MTHSLHRQGNSEDLRDEIVFIFSPSRGNNEIGAAPKVKKFLDIMKRHGAVNYGDDLTGNVLRLGHDQLVENARDVTNIHAVFADRDKAADALKEIAREDLGVSVVVAGLFDVLHECCQYAGVQFHTKEHSMGIWGKTELLPSESHLQLITMCGHGLVSANLIDKLVSDIRAGITTSEEAAYDMARQCMCGIFNPVRAKTILDRLVSE